MAYRQPTERQLEVFDIISESLEERGFPPSFREISIALDISERSSAGIFQHLEALTSKGLILRHRNVSRGITLTEVGKALAAARKAARS